MAFSWWCYDAVVLIQKSLIFAFIFHELRNRFHPKPLLMLHSNLFGWIACKPRNIWHWCESNEIARAILCFWCFIVYFSFVLSLVSRFPFVITSKERKEKKKDKEKLLTHVKSTHCWSSFRAHFLHLALILIHQRNYNFALARSFASIPSHWHRSYRSSFADRLCWCFLFVYRAKSRPINRNNVQLNASDMCAWYVLCPNYILLSKSWSN